MSEVDNAFWAGRRVFLTGHSGFKGSWATLWLSQMGAKVTGFSLLPNTNPALFGLAGVANHCNNVIGDINDREALQKAVMDASPEIVIHMAAQPLVRVAYDSPIGTFATNVMGTAHLLDAVRDATSVQTVLVITTDKVYENNEAGQAFVESDPLGGHDPYSASKAAAEIVAASWRRSFLDAGGKTVLTARGGNVIGGGDFSADRIVPDIWRSARAGIPLMLRNPNATRPWQHVLDCVAGYFCYVQVATNADAGTVQNSLNFGPRMEDGVATVAVLAEAIQSGMQTQAGWQTDQADRPHEIMKLALDPTAARDILGWQGKLDTSAAIDLTAAWYRDFSAGKDPIALTLAQIDGYMHR